ncbi:unnamed protein product [Macrosiphum euphorbiae]|uniref:Uncharacterized protein n=1 Tax=Macrosiphum euphorbiae TaxID=13131 RepID=A0AAV0WM22_9HEMI|nr:unnamed protein product [Macrosiphum euphorbiae]
MISLKKRKSVKFNVDQFKNENIIKKYADSIDLHLKDCRAENKETDWNKIRSVIKEAAERSIGGVQNGNKNKKKKWYNKLCREAMEKRRVARADFIKSGNQGAKDIFLIERKSCKRMLQREKGSSLILFWRKLRRIAHKEELETSSILLDSIRT